MRVGLTCTTIEPALTRGRIDGIGVYTKSLYEQFLQRQLQVIPYSFPRCHSRQKTSGLAKGKVFPIPYKISRFISTVRPTSRLLYGECKQHIDFLHVTDHMIPRVTSVPMIATIHDTLMFRAPPWECSKLKAFKNYLRNRTTRWVKHFITISDAMVPELVEFLKISENNISVVRNGLSDWWLEPVSFEIKQQVLKKYGLPEKILLHTGTLQPRKNVPRLITAYLELPEDIRREYPLVIVGRAGWDMDETLAAIDKLTACKAGYWLNDVSNDELRALFQSATLYFCPSLHEGFGLTMLEAFASKAAVVAANVAAIPEIAGDAAYLIDPYSVDELKQSMQALLTNETLRCQLIEKGVIRLKEFSLEKCASETLKVYQRVI